jgi:hypothetical protein
MDDDPWFVGEFAVVRSVNGEAMSVSTSASLTDGDTDVEEGMSPPSLTPVVGASSTTPSASAAVEPSLAGSVTAVAVAVDGGHGKDVGHDHGHGAEHEEQHVVEVRRGRLWLRPRLVRDWGDKDRHRKVTRSSLCLSVCVCLCPLVRVLQRERAMCWDASRGR